MKDSRLRRALLAAGFHYARKHHYRREVCRRNCRQRHFLWWGGSCFTIKGIGIEEPKMKFLMSSAAIAALAFVPTTANAGGSSYGCGASPCASGFNSGASRYGGGFGQSGGNGLIGAGVGAALGGVLGSQLAGSGARTEGSYIGAALGGAAGYAIGNGGFGSNGGFGYGGGSYGGGYGPGFIGGGLPPAPVPYGPAFIHSGQYLHGPVIPVTRYTAPRIQPLPILSQPRTVYTAPVFSGLTIAAPNVSLAGPPIRSTVVRRTISVEAAPIARAQRYVDPIIADCPAGTTQQSDGTCLERSYTPAPTFTPAPSYSPPVISQPYNPPQMADCPSGTTKQADGTCLERSYSSSSSYSSSWSYSAPAPQMAACPAGTSKQSDGTCLSSAVTSYTPSYTTSSVSTTYRAPAPTTTYHVPDTVVRANDEYCYTGSNKRYDSLGNEIKSRHSEHCRDH